MGHSEDEDAKVDEAVQESFPASDAPTGWSGQDEADVMPGPLSEPET